MHKIKHKIKNENLNVTQIINVPKQHKKYEHNSKIKPCKSNAK